MSIYKFQDIYHFMQWVILFPHLILHVCVFLEEEQFLEVLPVFLPAVDLLTDEAACTDWMAQIHLGKVQFKKDVYIFKQHLTG